MAGSVLLLGGSGYVGTAFQNYFRAEKVAYCNLRRTEADYTNPVELESVLRELRPAIVINAAGYTGKPNIDACEDHQADCLLGNAVLPGVIRAACEQMRVPWAHISSGCIYAGAHPDGSGFTEEDPPNFDFRHNNCSFYSGSKALGEEVLRGADSCYIWRIRIPFNHVDNPRNYLTKLMSYQRLLDARNSLSQLDEVVQTIWQCWEQRVPFGTYNVTNPGSITTREVVELIQQSGVCRKEFKFFFDEDEFMHQAAKTPRSNCVLDTTKLQRTGIVMTEVHDAIAAALRHWETRNG